MQRLLVWLLLGLGFLWLLRRLGGGGAAPRRQAAGPPGRMVRDRMCQTFLPEDRALSLVAAGRTHYFCSLACRDRFLAPTSPA
jgi:YHS domain-containing protein